MPKFFGMQKDADLKEELRNICTTEAGVVKWCDFARARYPFSPPKKKQRGAHLQTAPDFQRLVKLTSDHRPELWELHLTVGVLDLYVTGQVAYHVQNTQSFALGSAACLLGVKRRGDESRCKGKSRVVAENVLEAGRNGKMWRLPSIEGLLQV
ncbi:hypothetical protein AK812_SmicGene42524 [Symbiodinium microadriaticum]|uniref:Uncharacterized protein n=1 Tax=Symbiodinium microadriaticum TaxID=2951 RepID=A0A1Q9C3C5_SYMMI|nr:hypothetical protein AK812_SmicGene42524 [Symbiodinium microadriaticum]